MSASVRAGVRRIEAECHPCYREGACSSVIGLFGSQEGAPSSEEETRPVTLLVISRDETEKR